MTLNINNPNNAMYGYVQETKKKIDKFIGDHNTLSSSSISYDMFDKKFHQRMRRDFDEIK